LDDFALQLPISILDVSSCDEQDDATCIHHVFQSVVSPRFMREVYLNGIDIDMEIAKAITTWTKLSKIATTDVGRLDEVEMLDEVVEAVTTSRVDPHLEELCMPIRGNAGPMWVLALLRRVLPTGRAVVDVPSDDLPAGVCSGPWRVASLELRVSPDSSSLWCASALKRARADEVVIYLHGVPSNFDDMLAAVAPHVDKNLFINVGRVSTSRAGYEQALKSMGRVSGLRRVPRVGLVVGPEKSRREWKGPERNAAMARALQSQGVSRIVPVRAVQQGQYVVAEGWGAGWVTSQAGEMREHSLPELGL